MNISVIIPTYNRGHFIREAIDSVLNQDLRGCSIELIIVDDGSTDNTADIVKTYGAAVKYMYQKNRGAGAARNLGIESATGEWISFLDSDDRWLPHKLSVQFEVLKHFPDCKAIHSNFYIFDETGVTIEKGLEYWVTVFTGVGEVDWSRVYANKYNSRDFNIYWDGETFNIYWGNIFRAQLHAPYVSCWTLLARRECFGSDIRFAENYPTLEDYWLICRLAEKHDFIFMDVATAENRGHRGPRLTQAAYVDKLKLHIDICDKLYLPSQSTNKPSDDELGRQYKQLHVSLFKEYMKKGMRTEAKATYRAIQAMNGRCDDRTFYLYRLALLLPFNVIGMLVLFKRFILGAG
jgi:glycosyltransferase involved in cell wall biosynthesis